MNDWQSSDWATISTLIGLIGDQILVYRDAADIGALPLPPMPADEHAKLRLFGRHCKVKIRKVDKRLTQLEVRLRSSCRQRAQRHLCTQQQVR